MCSRMCLRPPPYTTRGIRRSSTTSLRTLKLQKRQHDRQHKASSTLPDSSGRGATMKPSSASYDRCFCRPAASCFTQHGLRLIGPFTSYSNSNADSNRPRGKVENYAQSG